MKVILFLLDHLSKEEAEAEWDREKLRYLKVQGEKKRGREENGETIMEEVKAGRGKKFSCLPAFLNGYFFVAL